MDYGDLVEVTRLFIDAYSKPPWNEKWDYNKAFIRTKEVFDTNNSICVVCVIEDSIVGAILSLLIPWTNGYQLEIRDFFIDTRYQNKSIGSSMLTKLRGFLTTNERIEIVLNTKRDNKLQHFYEKNGFFLNNDIIYYTKKL